MPGGYSKRDAAAQNGGNYRTRFSVHQPARGVSATGSVIRNPPGVGRAADATNPQPDSPLWVDYGEVLPYGGADRTDNGREASQLYYTIECRWGRNKPYAAGQMLYIFGTGETFQIDSTRIVGTRFRKISMICRNVS